MSDFKAKMNRNPKFGWRSLQRSPDPQLDLRGPTSTGRGGNGSGGDGRGGDGKVGKGRRGEGSVVQWKIILKLDPEFNSEKHEN